MKRLLAAATLSAAFLIPVAVFATMGTAESTTAAQLQYAPSNTAAPTAGGTAQGGATLTAGTGTWASSSAVTYGYQWQRCNATGAACVEISGRDEPDVCRPGRRRREHGPRRRDGAEHGRRRHGQLGHDRRRDGEGHAGARAPRRPCRSRTWRCR